MPFLPKEEKQESTSYTDPALGRVLTATSTRAREKAAAEQGGLRVSQAGAALWSRGRSEALAP